ncbi:MAG: MBOAT family protein [Planctomycetaceae bacterium]|nr:MBOAT family protein [Planctomycetales bacterium]MCB9923780.1 MBOAT family protein [Planctomycetaceae bacterium]
MLFNSLLYIAFLIAVCGLYYVAPPRNRWLLLLVASYAFYMCWNAFYVVLIIASTLVDYTVALMLGRTESMFRRKLLVGASLLANLGLLFVFKYWNFFNQSVAELCDALAIPWSVPNLNVLLPVGISFYTFQTLSYTIDVYRKQLQPEQHLGRFALYVSFFPQLVAGPIERAQRLLPQLRVEPTFNADVFLSGVLLIMWGLFKKTVIADRLSVYVDAVYGNVPDHNGLTYLLATYAFAFQIYCDFSGYTDIAIGSARILGIDLMSNFRSPYFSRDLQDFWRRWHISLSSWLRDYLYIPLGGNRFGSLRTHINLMVTMLLGGLWHGASWNFVIWGALHGGGLALLKATRAFRERIVAWLQIPEPLLLAAQLTATFHFVCLTWIFFRAATLSEAVQILRGIAMHWESPYIEALPLAHGLVGIAVLLLVELYLSFGNRLEVRLLRSPTMPRWVAYYALFFAIALLGAEGGRQFIYFQF